MNCENYEDLLKLWLARAIKKNDSLVESIAEGGSKELAKLFGLIEWFPRRFGDEPIDSVNDIGKSLLATVKRYKCRYKNAKPAAFIDKNIINLAALLGLNDVERQVLLFLVLFAEEHVLQSKFELDGGRSVRQFCIFVANALSLTDKQVYVALHRSSRLISTSLIEWDESRGSHKYIYPRLTHASFQEKLLLPDTDVKTLLMEVAIPAQVTRLKYRDYDYLQDKIQILRHYVRDSLKRKRVGVNIFLYGKPGTGKSELPRVIAREMRALLYEVSFQKSGGRPSNGYDRLVSLQLAQQMLSKQRTLIVFDEMEDAFRSESQFGRGVAHTRKAWMNRIFEENLVPTFWISNSHDIDPAFIRRFDYVLEMNSPPISARSRTYKMIGHPVISQATIETIVDNDAVTPAIVERACKVTSAVAQDASAGTRDEIFQGIIKSTLKAQGARYSPARSTTTPMVYSLEYLNCGVSLPDIGAALRQNPVGRLCLYGPPGTGKTSFGHWLSSHLSKPIIVKKPSDLLSKWLGEAEKLMAAAFEEARESEAILLIDEVDSFLQDRRSAKQRWEISTVNEMLIQMENFEGIFIASTNLMAGLDQASLRRFDLKIHFNFLLGEQVAGLLRSWCKQLHLPPPDEAALHLAHDLTKATPGDFTNVARQHKFKNFASAQEFIKEIDMECRLKEGGQQNGMGF